MSNQILTASEIIETIQKSIDFHTNEVEKLKAMLLAVGGKPSVSAASNGKHINIRPIVQPKLFTGTTIREKQLNEIISIMSTLDKPLLKTEIMETFNVGKKKQLKKATVGAILSEAVKDGLVKNVVYNDLPNGLRNWWVLSSWVGKDGNLNNSYYQKIKV